jgi:hypothetical protein
MRCELTGRWRPSLAHGDDKPLIAGSKPGLSRVETPTMRLVFLPRFTLAVAFPFNVLSESRGVREARGAFSRLEIRMAPRLGARSAAAGSERD